MTDRTPVTTLAELDALDKADMVEGYHDGAEGLAEPGNNRSRAYWHGWRNGRVDAGLAEKDAAQVALAREYLARNRLLNAKPAGRA